MLNVRTPARRSVLSERPDSMPGGGGAQHDADASNTNVFSGLGSLIQNTVADAISGLSLNTGAASSSEDTQPMSITSHVSAMSHVSAPRTIDALFAERERARAAEHSKAGAGAMSPREGSHAGSEGDCASWCSEDSRASSVQVLSLPALLVQQRKY